MKTGRNEPCLCGSGKKYKKCCLEVDNANGPFARAVPLGNGLYSITMPIPGTDHADCPICLAKTPEEQLRLMRELSESSH